MKKTLLFCLIWFFCRLCAEESGILSEDYQLGEGQVLIELFTSEGCSSCPPVEELFTRLANEARAEGHAVYMIAWHVDYWDRLKTAHGVWKDPFSSPASTQHQKNYAKTLTERGVTARPLLITPQMVFNGRPYRWLRKKERDIGKIMQASAARSGGVEIEASVKRADQKALVAWTLAGEQVHATQTVTAVLIESGLKSEITGGENHGKTLVHDHVVRGSAAGSAGKGKGEFTLSLPEDWMGKRGAVMLVVQDADLQLRAVKELPLPQQVAPAEDASLPTADPVEEVVTQYGVCGPEGCPAEGAHPHTTEGSGSAP